VVNTGTVVTAKVRVDDADEEGLLFCADGRSAFEGAPKIGVSVRRLFACLDMITGLGRWREQGWAKSH